ncbi:MAG: hypothetical protein ACR2QF_03140 [Geminicoccaceae bacterium]
MEWLLLLIPATFIFFELIIPWLARRRSEVADACLKGIGQLPEAYGVTLRRFVNQELGRDVGFAQISQACEDLEKANAVVSRYEQGGPERGYRHKLVYALR